MATVKIANFAFLQSGSFTLPGIMSSPGNPPHIRGKETIYFDLPNDARPRGMLSFTFDTARGADDGIDVAFEVTVNAGSKYAWLFNGDVYAGVQLPVFSLKPGDNAVTFQTTKAGKVTAPDPDEFLGGKGVVNFGAVCLTYHRDVTV